MNVQLLHEVIELNQAFERVIEGLKRMEKVSFLQAAMVREDRAEVVLAQIDFNRLFFGDFHKDYERDEKWAADFQRACLAKRCDPEDDYIGVRQREEARKKKGLPPRVVFLPDWDMRDEQRYDEAQTERQKKAAKKRRKKVLKTKPKRNHRSPNSTPGAKPNAPQDDHERGNAQPGDRMKAEALAEADSRRKNQCSRKGKRQGTVVDLPFVLVIRPKKAQQEYDGRPCSRNSQNQ